MMHGKWNIFFGFFFVYETLVLLLSVKLEFNYVFHEQGYLVNDYILLYLSNFEN